MVEPYPSEKWWNSSVGMMKFTIWWESHNPAMFQSAPIRTSFKPSAQDDASTTSFQDLEELHALLLVFSTSAAVVNNIQRKPTQNQNQPQKKACRGVIMVIILRRKTTTLLRFTSHTNPSSPIFYSGSVKGILEDDDQHIGDLRPFLVVKTCF